MPEHRYPNLGELTDQERYKVDWYTARGVLYLRQLDPPSVDRGDVAIVSLEPPFGYPEYLPFEVLDQDFTPGTFVGRLLALPEQGLAAFGMARGFQPEDSLDPPHNWTIPRWAVFARAEPFRNRARLKNSLMPPARRGIL